MRFDDLSALNAELESRIAAAGMTVDEYGEFKGRQNTSPGIRSAVGRVCTANTASNGWAGQLATLP